MQKHWQGFTIVATFLGATACGDQVSLDFSDSHAKFSKQTESFSQEIAVKSDSGFYDQPLRCDDEHSIEYYCDGYSPLKTYELPDSPRITPENFTTQFPPANFVGMQVLGEFDQDRPTMIYMHGWAQESPDVSLGMPDTWISQAQAANFNTVYFHWSAHSYDSGEGCPGLGVFGSINSPCNATHNIFKKNGIAALFINEYKSLFTDESAPVRLVGHSMGSNLAIFTSYLMHVDPSLNGITKPSRLDLIDPFVSPGMGGDRDEPYDGQIPRDRQLSSLYKNNIVTDFYDGSNCHDDWIIFIPPNHLSQYCQLEGMLYSLIKDHDVPALILSSVVGGATAQDFSKVGVFQAFSGSAFEGDMEARHMGPLAAYMYSFAFGEPNNGYDASSSDELIYDAAYAQAVYGDDVSIIQTSGYDTISLLDDKFSPR